MTRAQLSPPSTVRASVAELPTSSPTVWEHQATPCQTERAPSPLDRVAKLPPPSLVSSKVSWLPTSQPVLELVSACGETNRGGCFYCQRGGEKLLKGIDGQRYVRDFLT